MAAQPPLPLVPAEAVRISQAAALVEGADGGRVYIHGELCLCWDAGDETGRRHAACQLVRIGAARPGPAAAAFGVRTATLWRWRHACSQAGVVGLVGGRRGPKGPSKLTPALVAEIRARRGKGESLRQVASAVGVSEGGVRQALARHGGDETRAAGEGARPTPGTGRGDAPGRQGAAGGEATGEHASRHDTDDADGPDLPVLADPAGRTVERALASWGLLGFADPVFTPSARVPLAGLLLALPGLEAAGLLACAGQVYGRLPNGFYGLDTVLTEAVFRTLAGEPRAEGATRLDPVALGRALGMDRAPEVKTIRRKFHQLARAGKASDLLAVMARRHLRRAGQADPELAAVLYVDGHTRAWHGKRRIGKTHVARLKFPAPATVETWVADSAGNPVLVVMAEPGASLAGELRRLLPELRSAVGDGRRVLVGFDRGGWSPALFKAMCEAGFDVLTWRKGPAGDVAEDKFTDVTHAGPDERPHTWNAAETVVELPLDDKGVDTFAMRQVTRRDRPGGRQIHIVTTVAENALPTAEAVHRMGSRWRQENMFRYGRMRFELDSHDCYRHGDDDPGRSVPNPAKKHARNAVAAARARLDREAARADAALLEKRSPAPGGETVLSNEQYNHLTADLRSAEDQLAAAEQANRGTPARLPLGQVNPGQQILEVETKLLTHAVKIAAFNTTSALARDLRLHTGYARAGDDAHTIVRQVLAHTGDIDPDPDAGTLTVRLDPMPTARVTRAVAELCQHLTETQTVYPGTDLKLRYEIKTRP